jgi:hypothetical protein
VNTGICRFNTGIRRVDTYNKDGYRYSVLDIYQDTVSAIEIQVFNRGYMYTVGTYV